MLPNAETYQDQAPTISRADLDAALDALASMDRVDYAIMRKTAAKKLGVRTGELDDFVAARRPSEVGEGDNLGLYDPKPWPEPVDGSALLDEITAALRRFVVLPKFAAEAVALWIAHCYCFEIWDHTPRLSVMAPEKGCGKTTLLEVLEKLTPRAKHFGSTSAAVLFRIIDAHKPTLLADEVDTYLTGRNADTDVKGILNEGHRKSGVALRCVGDNHEVKSFKCFAPVAVAGIGNLPGPLADRSIAIHMQRRSRLEQVDQFRERKAGALREVSSRVARWVADHLEALESHEAIMPKGLADRRADNWEPLISIADIAGGKWPALAREAAIALSKEAEGEGDSLPVMLLKDMRLIFERLGVDRISSQDLADKLHDIEDSPWSEYSRAGKAITPAQIAKLLKRFGIAPGTIRYNGATPKGYKLDGALKDVLARYLPHFAATPPQATDDKGLGDSQAATRGTDVAAKKTLYPLADKGCGGVAARNEGCPGFFSVSSDEGNAAPALANGADASAVLELASLDVGDLEERAAIISEGCGISQEEATRRARAELKQKTTIQ